MDKIDYLFKGIVIVMSLIIIGNILFEKKGILKKFKTIMIIVLSAMFTLALNIYNETLISNTLRIILLFTMFIVIYKVIYKKDITITIIASFIAYLIYFIAEIIVDIPLYILLYLLEISSESARNVTIVNVAVSIISILITYLNKEKLKHFIKNGNIDRKITIGTSILILFTLSILIFSTPVNKLKFDANFVITMVLILLFCIIGFILIKQRIDTQKITDKYVKLAKYSQNNEGLLEEYRMNLHENKNRLIRIDNMVPEEYTEIHKYIDELIKINRSNKYYWLTELKYVPSSELKGFMNYKIMEMIDNKLNVEVNISRELDKKTMKNYSVKDKEDLYSIIGIFLDNAYEASKPSKEKSVSIQMYMEKKNIKLIIANTYKGKIDIEKIDEYGYSSKGANRGTGLYIVNEIVNRNQLFEKWTSLLDNYFVQTLTIKSKKLKKKKIKK